jgi:hypothetical protein
MASSVGVRGLAFANIYREAYGGGPVIGGKGGFHAMSKPRW